MRLSRSTTVVSSRGPAAPSRCTPCVRLVRSSSRKGLVTASRAVFHIVLALVIGTANASCFLASSRTLARAFIAAFKGERVSIFLAAQLLNLLGVFNRPRRAARRRSVKEKPTKRVHFMKFVRNCNHFARTRCVPVRCVPKPSGKPSDCMQNAAHSLAGRAREAHTTTTSTFHCYFRDDPISVLICVWVCLTVTRRTGPRASLGARTTAPSTFAG